MALGRFIALLVFFTGLAGPAQAAAPFCSGMVSSVVSTWSGQLLTSFGTGLFGVCDLEGDGPHTIASKETCGAWCARPTAAKSTGTQVMLAPDTNTSPDADMTSCDDLVFAWYNFFPDCRVAGAPRNDASAAVRSKAAIRRSYSTD